MDYLPIFVRLLGQEVLVIGAGAVAARKVDLLLDAGARVTVVAPELGDALRSLEDAGHLRHLARSFRDEDVAGRLLIVAATDDVTVNRRAADAAARAGILVNVVDDPRLCSFIMPSIVDRSPLVAAVSTGGSAPVLARVVRARIEAALPAALGAVAELAARLRPLLRERLPDGDARRRFWEDALDGWIAIPDGGTELTEASLRASLDRASGEHEPARVVLLSLPSNDPDRLTLQALRVLQSADAIVHDARTATAVLARARRDAERHPFDAATATSGSVRALASALTTSSRRVVLVALADADALWRSLCTLDAEVVRVPAYD